MKDLFKVSFQTFLPSFKALFWIVVPLSLVQESLDFFLMDLGRKNSDLLIYFQICVFLLSLLWSFVYLTLLPPVIVDVIKGHHIRKLTKHFGKYFSQLSIESLRCLPPTLIGFLMLILPGFLEMMRLMFVPFVVQFDKDYDLGQVDALEKSRKLAKNNLMFVFQMALASLAVSVLPYLFTGDAHPFDAPLAFLRYVMLTAVTNLFSQILVTACFIELEKKLNGTQI